MTAPRDTIVCRFDSDAQQWLAYFENQPQAGFGSDQPVGAIRRLLEGTEAPADDYLLLCQSDRAGSGILRRSFTWNQPEMLFVCQSRDGKGEYVGMERESCQPCQGRGVIPV